MDANTVFDATSAIGSAGAGNFAAIISQIIKAKMEHDEKMITLLGQRVEIADSSADKAAARTGDAGKIIRRMIYFGCAFTIIVAPFILPFYSQDCNPKAIYIEKRTTGLDRKKLSESVSSL